MIPANIKIKNTLWALLLGSGVAVFIFCFRVVFFHTDTYAFLIWNLFLAWIPFLFALFAVRLAEHKSARWFIWITILLWLLFFPNAPYILTDLGHLARVMEWPGVPLGFDVVMLLTFVLNGLFLGFVSLFLIEGIWRTWFGPRLATLFSLLSLILAGFAMYLGRFLRWNSWDIAHRPFALIGDVLQRFFEPWLHPMTWGFSILYGLFLMAIYVTLLLLKRAPSGK